ncbi:MAG: hypothetical protein IKZ82_12785 [Clostridia bacterium]|nr:hypothetical protein [Clostridia bacterium]
MKKTDNKRKIQNFNAETADSSGLDGLGTASSSEATGMMYCPPRSEDELRSREQLFTLQVDMPPEGYVGTERDWRADIEGFYRNESKPTIEDPQINYMGRHDVLDPANTFFAPDDPRGV